MPNDTKWQGSPHRRLGYCMLIAALVLAGALSMLRYPVTGISPDLVDLLVQIVEPEPPAEVAEITPPESIPEALPPPKLVEPLPEPQPQAEPEQESVADDPEPWTDWQAIGEEVVKEVVASEAKTISVNPMFDEKRRIAAVRFRPSRAPGKKEIWDNVEKDYLGRTLLWHGDCYRVIDDPSAVYRDVFENFTQYMTTCLLASKKGRELPWVAEVREQHAYLQRRLDSRSSAITN